MEKKRDSFFLHNKKKQGVENAHKNSSKKRQDEFIKNRDIAKTETASNLDKKPFDKKAYRLKKYSRKYKLDQWEEMRKKKVLYNYYKEIKADPVPGTYKQKTFDEDTVDSLEGRFVRHPDLIEKENENAANNIVKAKTDPYHKAKEQYNKIKEQKQQKQQEVTKAKEEREQKLQEYKKKKKERFMKLSKKTKKGQPVLSGRLELLLEEIQTNPKKK